MFVQFAKSHPTTFSVQWDNAMPRNYGVRRCYNPAMSVRSELLAVTEQVATLVEIPKVRQVFLPEPSIDATKDAEFGLVELEGGATGLFYAWLGDSQRGMGDRFKTEEFVGADALRVARYLARENDMFRSIGLATVNAISQHVFNLADFEPGEAPDSMAGITLNSDDKLGMIGNFPPLVRQARSQDIPVTVVERKSHMQTRTSGLTITLDPRSLAPCNKIICTAATLINDSIDEMLPYCAHADVVAVIGPSASFFPEPLFTRGVEIVAGTHVRDASLAISEQQLGRGLRSVSSRYVLSRDSYPGALALCNLMN